jgi:hypothetical protein
MVKLSNGLLAGLLCLGAAATPARAEFSAQLDKKNDLLRKAVQVRGMAWVGLPGQRDERFFVFLPLGAPHASKKNSRCPGVSREPRSGGLQRHAPRPPLVRL